MALSLGLVGALSIIRFRTPVKEPEELAYIFISIALGIGLGAGQIAVSLTSFLVVLLVIIFSGLYVRGPKYRGIFLDLESEKTSDLASLSKFVEILKSYDISHELKRYQSHESSFSATFYIEPKNIDVVDEVIEKLGQLDKSVNLSILNQNKNYG
tara:strand:+ start:175 stop:639 length:465 start_codon:yes stop_codon:yes gene_type:complete